jgi:hypothetical protein
MYQYKNLLRLSLLALLYFVVLFGVDTYTQHHQKKLVVYSVNQSNAIQFVNGNTSKLLLEDNLRYDKQKFRFHLQQHIWQMGLQQIDTLIINNQWQLIGFKGKHILISGDEHYPESTQHIDVLIVRYKLKPELLKQINAKQVLISGSVKKHHAEKIKAHCLQQNIPVHDVLYSGAFQLSL